MEYDKKNRVPLINLYRIGQMEHSATENEAIRLLAGLENGTMAMVDAYQIAEACDPVIIFFIFRYLREKYHAQNPMSAGIISRLVDLTSNYPILIKKSQKGESDLITEWFDDTYNIRDFFTNPNELVELIINKIEG